MDEFAPAAETAPIGDDEESIARWWSDLGAECVALGFGFFVNESGERVTEPVHDARGYIFWRMNPPEREPEKPEPHARTLADVNLNHDPQDAFDAAVGALPLWAGQSDKARAALMANVPGPIIQARLNCASTTVSKIRSELRAEIPESEWPESLSDPHRQSRRVNAERPSLRAGAPKNSITLRAARAGVSEAEIRQRDLDTRNKRKFLERQEDLQKNVATPARKRAND